MRFGTASEGDREGPFFAPASPVPQLEPHLPCQLAQRGVHVRPADRPPLAGLIHRRNYRSVPVPPDAHDVAAIGEHGQDGAGRRVAPLLGGPFSFRRPRWQAAACTPDPAVWRCHADGVWRSGPDFLARVFAVA